MLLIYNDVSLNTGGLLDTGASVNVLPHEIGLELGLNWDEHNTEVILTGNLAQFQAKGVILSAQIEGFDSVTLVFAWTQAQNIPLLLGRVNFFQAFDVCFYGSQLIFEVALSSTKFKLQ
ncbi:aspartyl protease family protein [Crocosphaera sp. UHCC 0190]|uniref:aspartyl protease family protein n=1 Tax=Crocosphaera sp. UHCC 0190 TaxID=3110246 RepID=UPI003A522BA4